MAHTMCSLSWRDHYKIIAYFLGNLLDTSALVDCSLAAEGQHINAHKVVLSACSPYLKMLFCEGNDQYPIIILQDVKFQDLKALMDFMYKGEIQIPEERVASFLEIAQTLQIRGLSIGEEIRATVRITQMPKESGDLPSPSRISLRRDLLDPSRRAVDPPQQQASECKQCGPPSLFNVASSSSVFLPKNDSLNECEEHFEVDRLLDDPVDRRNVKCHLNVERSVWKEKDCALREENSNTPCEALTKPSSPQWENLVANPQSTVRISLPSELDSCNANEPEESIEMDRSLNDPEDRKDVKSLVDIVEHSISDVACEELGEEKLGSIDHSSTIPSILPGGNLAAGSQRFAEIYLPDEEHSCSVHEGEEDIETEESPDDSDDCMEVEVLDTAVNSVCEEETGERNLEDPQKAQSSSRVATGLRGENTIPAAGDGPLIVKPIPCHSQAHTRQKYECGVCERRFSCKSRLDSHMPLHTGDRHFLCSVCGKILSSKGNLTKHMRMHTGERPYQCTICGKSLSTNERLIKHIRLHTGEKPYQCSVCGMSFSSKDKLTLHIRSHTGERPHQCFICQKKFTLKSSLNQHMHLHTGEKPYQCYVCQASFSFRTQLNRHMPLHSEEI